ncbi:MAG: ABC transporter permease subunit [Proteobacteria bacterium]|jgi:ABC-type nitrate/sulfonate/bicarbonate transport system permease component|nr:ABC transporter permease subunit [Pseudomonadota bacterium]MDA1059758.1 ABC transporter permease subunit [Pseudomonadota bacterium]
MAVAESIFEHLFEGELVESILATLSRAAVAFFISMAIGITVGLALGRSKGLDRFFDGWLVLGLNMPALVVAILCYIWFGLTEFALILAVCINKIPNVIATIREGARAIEPELIEVGRVYRLSWLQQLRQIYLPQLYPYIVAASRSGLALIWKIVLLFELLGRSSGVGFQLQVFFQFFDITSILAYAFAFIAVVLTIEGFVMRPVERRLTAWRL